MDSERFPDISSDQEYLLTFRLRQHLIAHKEFGDATDIPKELEDSLNEAINKYEELKGDSIRIGGWIPTVSGKRLWLLDPREDEIEPFDFAYQLSRMPRYNAGTIGKPYSVGQHSILGTRIIENAYKLHFLLHDVQEYIFHDIITPVKRCLGKVYSNLEDKLGMIISKKYNLDWTEEAIKKVKDVDNLMWVNEVNSLTPFKVTNRKLPCLPSGKIEVWSAEETFNIFCQTFKELTGIQIPSVEEVFNGK